MSLKLTGLVLLLKTRLEVQSQVSHLMDLGCQVCLQNFQDQVSTQMAQVGIGHVDSHKNLCQAQELSPRKNQHSQVGQALCQGTQQKSNPMGLLSAGQEPHPLMM